MVEFNTHFTPADRQAHRRFIEDWQVEPKGGAPEAPDFLYKAQISSAAEETVPVPPDDDPEGIRAGATSALAGISFRWLAAEAGRLLCAPGGERVALLCRAGFGAVGQVIGEHELSQGRQQAGKSSMMLAAGWSAIEGITKARFNVAATLGDDAAAAAQAGAEFKAAGAEIASAYKEIANPLARYGKQLGAEILARWNNLGLKALAINTLTNAAGAVPMGMGGILDNASRRNDQLDPAVNKLLADLSAGDVSREALSAQLAEFSNEDLSYVVYQIRRRLPNGCDVGDLQVQRLKELVDPVQAARLEKTTNRVAPGCAVTLGV